MSFTIKELETLTGIKAHTIRIWEQRYNFIKPSRTQTNIRTYSPEELKELLTVALLNKYGYKISRIDGMHPSQRRSEALMLQDAEAKNEQVVNDLIGSMIELDIKGFENLLDEHIKKHGIKHTITIVIFLFLEKVGILWQTFRINPAHEHIVSNIIRQKLIAAIEGLPLAKFDKSLHLLFLPEDEHHELGLLFIYYLLKEKGIPVIYLGASVPVKDVQYIITAKDPQYLYIHLTSLPLQLNLQKFISALSKNNCTLLISGYVTSAYKKDLPPNVSFLKSFSQVISYISSL